MPRIQSLKRILVANRGEIALRAVRTCRLMGIEAVAVYSEPDATARHVAEADHAVLIGPASATESYLSQAKLIDAAKALGCGAVYPGYGFLAENAEFARACADSDLKFIGPAAETIDDMGNKARAREVAQAYGVPVVPGSEGATTDANEAEAAAEEIGYPLLIKARSGGGGRGMRVVDEAGEFKGAFNQATREAEAAFSDGAVYLERFFHEIRHIEVQVLGDGRGGALVFTERDCSTQRRHQKLVEESPSPVVPNAVRAELLAAAKRLTEGLKYEGAGTVEFIFDPATNEFYFIEMNTRIQVEHPVTEMLTGLDLVHAQMEIAATGRLPEYGAAAAPGGHAIEFRINAEDWQNGFRPSPGLITGWRALTEPAIRIDTAVDYGHTVPPYYDSMIAKLIVHGADRAEAIERAKVALGVFRVDGIQTTAGFHRWLLDQEDFVQNRVHTRWLETDAVREQLGAAAA